MHNRRIRNTNTIMQLDTYTLTGLALDYAVARAAGQLWTNLAGHIVPKFISHYSTDGKEAAALMESAGIAVRRHSSGKWFAMLSSDLGDGTSASWGEFTAQGGERYGPMSYQVHKRRQRFSGDTMLEAAMRCYAGSLLGPTVDVPDELLALTINHDRNDKPATGDWTL